MAQPPIKVPLELDPQYDKFFSGLQQFTRRVQREVGGVSHANSGLESLFFSPERKFAQTMGKQIDLIPKQLGKAMKDVVKEYKTTARALKTGDVAALGLFPGIGGRAARGVAAMSRAGRGFMQTPMMQAMAGGAGHVSGGIGAVGKTFLGTMRVLNKEFKSFGVMVKNNTKSLQVMGRGLTKVARFMGRGAMGAGRLGMRGLGRAGRFGLRAAGGLAMGALGMIPGIFGGMMGGYYNEAIAATQQTQAAQLQAAGALGPGAKFVGGRTAARLGYNMPQAIQMQAQAARLGMGGGPGAGVAAMTLTRALGEEGLQAGAGMMRRQGLQGAAGTRTMMRDLSQVMAVAMATGLERARLPELLQAGNEYAEQQIAITPDKNAQKRFSLAVARMGEVVPEMFKGRYGAKTMMQMDRAIKSASGPFQAFVLRAAGFGQGTGFLQAIRQQEEGALAEGPRGELLIGRIIKQAISEGGAGSFGGLSGRALYSLSRHLGISTKAMEEVAKVYATESGDKARKKVEDIVKKSREEQKLAGKSTIEIDAFKSMKLFGSFAKVNADRFNQMAKQGQHLLPIKEAMNKMQASMGQLLMPIFKLIAKYLPIVANYVSALAKAISAFFGSYKQFGFSGAAAIAGGTYERALNQGKEEIRREEAARKESLLANKLRVDETFRSAFGEKMKKWQSAQAVGWKGFDVSTSAGTVRYTWQELVAIFKKLQGEGFKMPPTIINFIAKMDERGKMTSMAAQIRQGGARGKGQKGAKTGGVQANSSSPKYQGATT